MKRVLCVKMLFLCLHTGLFLFSCRTDYSILKDQPQNSFTPMAKIFNGENRSCPGVIVTLTNKRGKTFTAQTDITGKALFPPVSYDSYLVLMSKKGFEKVCFTFEYSRPDQILYGRLYSFEQLIKQSEKLIEKSQWDQAQRWLNRAEELNIDGILVIFYKAIIFWKSGYPRRAAESLEEYKKNKGPLPAEIEQFIKDIYKYDLKEELNETT